MMKYAKRLALLLVIAYALGCGYLFVAQRSFLYHGGNAMPDTTALASHGYEKVSYTTPDGETLWGLYRKPPVEGAPVILVFHGNAGVEPVLDDRAIPFSAINIGVLIATYRGFEGNKGSPTEWGLALDAQAAASYLNAQGITNDGIILYGHSLGSGVATELASRMVKEGKPAAALILESPFSRMVDMAKLQYWYMPVDILLQDRYDTIFKIKDVGAPVLVMHAKDDQTVPQNMGQAVCDAALIPKTCAWFETGGHMHLYEQGALKNVHDFLKDQSLITQ